MQLCQYWSIKEYVNHTSRQENFVLLPHDNDFKWKEHASHEEKLLNHTRSILKASGDFEQEIVLPASTLYSSSDETV